MPSSFPEIDSPLPLAEIRNKVILVFFNGPPYSGKDTAGKALVAGFMDSATMKLSGPLKRATHADLNFPPDLPDDYFEKVKDVPHPAFFGKTPRQAYIAKSEERMKPFFGDDIFGRLALRSLARLYLQGKTLIGVTDSGFAAEAQPLVEVVGTENCLLVRLHAEGRGCSFASDSRSYIELPGVATFDLTNDGPIPEFADRVCSLVRDFTLTKAPCVLIR